MVQDENRTSNDLEWMGQEFTIHHFSYAKENEKYMIWGLTAGILIHAASVVYQRPPDFAEKRAQFNLPTYFNAMARAWALISTVPAQLYQL